MVGSSWHCRSLGTESKGEGCGELKLFRDSMCEYGGCIVFASPPNAPVQPTEENWKTEDYIFALLEPPNPLSRI